jgi:hypothetical protein
MKFSDSANNAGIVEDTHFICGTNSTSYPVSDIARNANRHYYKAVIDYLRNQGTLQFDDSNHTTLPEYTFNLVAGQQQYSLPTNLLKLWGIEIVDNSGNYLRLSEINMADPQLAFSVNDYLETDGTPRYYELRGENIFLYPAPAAANTTLTAGGKMYFAREIDPFTAADTDQEPGLPEPFHRIISLGAAYDWLCINDTQAKADRILQQQEQLRAELRNFAANRNNDTESILRPAHYVHDYI